MNNKASTIVLVRVTKIITIMNLQWIKRVAKI